MTGEGRLPEFYWHIHHETLLENVWDNYGGISERITYIKQEKPQAEIPLRLHLIRPAINLPVEYVNWFETGEVPPRSKWAAIQETIKQLHELQCDPQCPWVFYYTPRESSHFNHIWTGNIFTSSNYNVQKMYTLRDGTVPEIKS